MSQLSGYVRDLVNQANESWEEAVETREQIEAVLSAIPDKDMVHRHDMIAILEQAVQSVILAYDIKHDLEVLEESVQALESVRGGE